MSKSISTKSKPPPWIPPGKGLSQFKKPIKPIAKNKNDDLGSPVLSPKKIMDFLKEEESGKNVETDTVSINSHSSDKSQNELDVHEISILLEMKLLYTHFASVKTSYLSAHRLIDFQEIEDNNINQLFTESEISVRKLNQSFDDLEYSVSVLENSLNETHKKAEYSNVYKIKEKLLSSLLDMYEKVLQIFQTVFEKQDFKQLSQLQDSLSKQLKLTEKNCISQDAVIKDLERRLSIYQGKTNAMESYKTNLESTKTDLEKQLLHKESQIKYLSNELMNASGKQPKSDHEELIEIIENIKTKAHADKSALKKALKFQKTQYKQNEEKYQNLVQELSEKEKMIFNIAAQRDQLKVHLTVLSNNIIQQKNQIEEMKIHSGKLQNEMDEKDVSHKKEIARLKDSFEEKSSQLDKSLKAKTKLEETIEELENELKKSKDQFKALKGETDVKMSMDFDKSRDVMFEEIQRLVSLLQDTKEVFENVKRSPHSVFAAGDHPINDANFDRLQQQILAVVKESKEHLLELKELYRALLEEQKDVPEQKDRSKKNDLEKRFYKMEQLYNATVKENQALQQEVEDLKNSSLANSTVQKTENYFTTNMSNGNSARKLQWELERRNYEIAQMKADMKRKEKDLEDELRECKDRLRAIDVDNAKISSLEEDLKITKLELSVLQKKKEEETEKLLQRTNELSIENESLQRYVQLLKSSFSNVFENL